MQHDDVLARGLTPAVELVEPMWLADPERWMDGVPFDPWRHDRAMVMAGRRPCGELPASLVIRR